MENSEKPEPPPDGRVLVLSPHLDDGVFACGRLLASLADATVATVFAGRPDPGFPLTDWDRAAGFQAGDDVVGKRREEDRRALDILGARPAWLDLRDAQYGGAGLAAVTGRLAALLEEMRPDAVFLPLGLFHSDHRLVRQAALALVPDYPGGRWVAYEDALYRRLPGLRDESVGELRQQGFAPQPVCFSETAGAAGRKAAAVACYRSQLQALASPGRPGDADLETPEAFWEISPPPRESHGS